MAVDALEHRVSLKRLGQKLIDAFGHALLLDESLRCRHAEHTDPRSRGSLRRSFRNIQPFISGMTKSRTMRWGSSDSSSSRVRAARPFSQIATCTLQLR